MNRSIMDQFHNTDSGTPKSRLPRKLQEKSRKQDSNNRDIEALIRSPKKSPVKVQSIKVSPSQKSDIKRDEAY